MICAYDECKKDFTPKTHNQKYCSDECCRIATNEKLKQAYYEKKERLAGKKRICKNKGCNVILSRYNNTNICDKCVSSEKEKERLAIVEMVKRVSS
jgi:ribosomal protein S27AE